MQNAVAPREVAAFPVHGAIADKLTAKSSSKLQPAVRQAEGAAPTASAEPEPVEAARCVQLPHTRSVAARRC